MSQHFIYCHVSVCPDQRTMFSIYFDDVRKKYLLIGALDAEIDEYDTESQARSAIDELVSDGD